MSSRKRASPSPYPGPPPDWIKRRKSRPPTLSTNLEEVGAIVVAFQEPAENNEVNSIRIECLERAGIIAMFNGSAIPLKHGDSFESRNEVESFEVMVGKRTLTYDWPTRFRSGSSSPEYSTTHCLSTPFQVYETSTAPTTATTLQSQSTSDQGSGEFGLENVPPPSPISDPGSASVTKSPDQDGDLVPSHRQVSTPNLLRRSSYREICGQDSNKRLIWGTTDVVGDLNGTQSRSDTSRFCRIGSRRGSI